METEELKSLRCPRCGAGFRMLVERTDGWVSCLQCDDSFAVGGSWGKVGKSFLYEIRIIPMTLAILAALFGGVLGWAVYGIKYNNLFLHVANVFLVLWAAHLVDTLNDVKRGEYAHGYKARIGFGGKAPRIDPKHYYFGIGVAYFVALMISGILVHETGLLYALFAAGGIALSVSYGSGLDRVFIGGDLAWEMGVILGFLGGYYVINASLDPPILAMIPILMVVLFGVKIMDALPDYEVDKQSTPMKRTVPVVLGYGRAKNLAYVSALVGLAFLAWMMIPMLPVFLTVLTCIALVCASYRLDPRVGILWWAVGIMLLLVVSILTTLYAI